jgi:alanyl-tRNA synthetase
MQVDRIYYTDSYAREFQASLVQVEADGAVLLDRTAFYPESGGQQDDRGTIAGVAVIGVEEREGQIVHRLASPPGTALRSGDKVHGVIDWARRYRLMQQHTGQHLLSAVAQSMFGWETASVHIGLAHATVEFAITEWNAEQLLALERSVNEEIASAHPVSVTIGEAASVLPLRKAAQRAADLRVVSIASLDHSACGGTHVRSTAEIGALLLGATEKIRKQLRLEFFCGLVAAERAAEQREVLNQISRGMQCEWRQSAALVDQRGRELLRLAKQEKALLRELSQWRGKAARAAMTGSEAAPACALRWVADSPGDADRAFAAAFCESPHSILLTLCRQSGAFMLSCSEAGSFAATDWLKTKATAAGARGGGSRNQVSGKVADPANLDQLAELLPGRATVLGDLPDPS